MAGAVHFFISIRPFSFRVYRILTLLIPFTVSWRRRSRWMDGRGTLIASPHSV